MRAFDKENAAERENARTCCCVGRLPPGRCWSGCCCCFGAPAAATGALFAWWG